MPPAVSSSDWPPTVPMVRELTAAVSNVMFWRLRPESIVSGELGAFLLKRAVAAFVVPMGGAGHCAGPVADVNPVGAVRSGPSRHGRCRHEPDELGSAYWDIAAHELPGVVDRADERSNRVSTQARQIA